MSLRQGTFAEKDLILVKSGADLKPHEPPLAIGETVTLLDGETDLLVVDLVDDDRVVVAWSDGFGVIRERSIASIILERVR
jgi:hypothetical protein